MIRWPWRRPGNPDPEAFLAELARSHPGGRRYTNIDRYRDFRVVFLDSDRGRRVLFEILGWGHVFKPSAPLARFEANKTFFHDGERNIALRIMATMNAEPSVKPTKATNVEKQE